MLPLILTLFLTHGAGCSYNLALKKPLFGVVFFCHFFKEKLAFFLCFDIIYTCLVASVTAPSEGQQTRAETLARVPESGLPREAG